ncbi:hypothetical protein [Actinoallomurus acaciae]|uniref:Transposase n=1 Tax=Actinoallomurus acaciae TaxID=502577 RepID=A0ABV5YTW1_9ACTN
MSRVPCYPSELTDAEWELVEPADFPPWQTVYWYLARWEEQRVTLRLLDALRRQVRLIDDRTSEPSAGIIDSQSAKKGLQRPAAPVGGRAHAGLDHRPPRR